MCKISVVMSTYNETKDDLEKILKIIKRERGNKNEYRTNYKFIKFYNHILAGRSNINFYGCRYNNRFNSSSY